MRETARAVFRTAILDAAEAVFAERGFHAARIQDVAVRAGIAVGTVYNHFTQKEDVLRALLDERTAALAAAMAPCQGDPEPFEARLTARVARLLRYADSHRAFIALAMDHGLLGGSTAAAASVLGTHDPRPIGRFRAAFLELVSEGVAAGALAPIDATRLARVLGGILRGLTLGAIESCSGPLADEAEAVVDLFLRGAAARPSQVNRRSGTPRGPRRRPS